MTVILRHRNILRTYCQLGVSPPKAGIKPIPLKKNWLSAFPKALKSGAALGARAWEGAALDKPHWLEWVVHARPAPSSGFPLDPGPNGMPAPPPQEEQRA